MKLGTNKGLREAICNNRQTNNQTNKQELNSKTMVDGIKEKSWGTRGKLCRKSSCPIPQL